jgi:hypothetical protein
MIPMVLALLGDNPMQSEFACHIGLKGKFFCRACWVKGFDIQAEGVQQYLDSPCASPLGSKANQMSECGSPSSDVSDGVDKAGTKTKARSKRALESMSNMVERVKAFIKVDKSH